MRFRDAERILFSLLLSTLLAGCGGRSLSRGSAQDLIVSLEQGVLSKEDAYIASVAQTGERNALVEARLRAQFRFERTGGKWKLKEVRLGNGLWVNYEDFMTALDKVRTEATERMLEQVSKAIERYREKNGKLPSFSDYVSLSDKLSPDYMSPLVRLDAWNRPLAATRQGPSTVQLMSSGPDGKFHTSDDVVLTKTFPQD